MQPHRRRWKPAKATFDAGLCAALAALYGDQQALSCEDLMAERERLRLDAEAEQRRQGELPLPSKVPR